MKKKILFILLTLLLTGCGSNSLTKSKIEDTDGNLVEMSAKDLVEIYNENEMKFKKTYSNSKIEITEEYDSISTAGNVTCVYLKNNWVIAYHSSTGKLIDVASELNKGDKLHFTGKIYNVGGYCDWNHTKVELEVDNNSIIEIVK